MSKLMINLSLASIFAVSGAAFAAEKNYPQAAQQLQQRLGKVLMTTIKKEGHVAAIRVCNEQAPEIARAVSQQLGVSVSRTALKVRNPDNSPTERQQQVLKQFEQQWQQSQRNDNNDVPATTYTNGQGDEVWMKAIVMQPQCSACHGSAIKPELKQAIKQRYPDDQATGFEVGDVRGAFVVTSHQSTE
ncbi:MAG: Tll0287-like domain-containing protein [Pseudomonadota bacterium]